LHWHKRQVIGASSLRLHFCVACGAAAGRVRDEGKLGEVDAMWRWKVIDIELVWWILVSGRHTLEDQGCLEGEKSRHGIGAVGEGNTSSTKKRINHSGCE
jgi:hypothetical protein